MMARVEMFAPDEVAIVHVMNRTVWLCFFMGNDTVSGKNFDHRKEWVETELKHLAAGFGIDLLCDAFQSLSTCFEVWSGCGEGLY